MSKSREDVTRVLYAKRLYCLGLKGPRWTYLKMPCGLHYIGKELPSSDLAERESVHNLHGMHVYHQRLGLSTEKK